MQTLTPNGLKFIQAHEGCVLHPYQDISGVWTIGWGMTHYPNGIKVTGSDLSLTQEQADTFFAYMVKIYSDSVLGVVKVPLNSNQLCALTDFAYNCGITAFRNSILLQHVNNHCVVESDFTIYDHAGGKEVLSLLNRRKAEYNVYITNVPNAVQPQPIKHMIKWTKFFDSASKVVVTYFNDTATLQNDGMLFEFDSAEAALEGSTSDVFVFWDSVPMGAGKVAA